MTENTREEQEHVRSRWSTLSRGKRLTLVLSLVVSAAAISLLIALSRKSCNTNEREDCKKTSVEEENVQLNVHVRRFFGVVFGMIFLVSVCVILFSCRKKTRERNSREMAVSYIPDEDLDKSPALTLPYFPPFGNDSSSQLPDYFTAVQNIPEVSSQLNEGFWTQDIDGSGDENEKPPSYEQALTKSGLSANAADLENQAG